MRQPFGLFSMTSHCLQNLNFKFHDFPGFECNLIQHCWSESKPRSIIEGAEAIWSRSSLNIRGISAEFNQFMY